MKPNRLHALKYYYFGGQELKLLRYLLELGLPSSEDPPSVPALTFTRRSVTRRTDGKKKKSEIKYVI